MEPSTFDAATLTIIGTVLAVGISLAGLMLRTSALMDRRMERMDRRMDRFDDAMAAFRTEMQRLAERQSHVEGRIEERGTTGHGRSLPNGIAAP